jgi:RND family efflux transporter MFP subunit
MPGKKENVRITVIFSAVIIALGILALVALNSRDNSASMLAPPLPGRLVEIISADYTEQNVSITAFGRVTSARELQISAQVSGQIIYTAGENGVKNGLRVKRGELICLIDTTDYALNMRLLEKQMDLAEANLPLAEESLELARLEVDRVKALMAADNSSPKAFELARLQEISRHEKVLSLKAQTGEFGTSSISYQQAKVRYDRCFILAPFDLEVTQADLVSGTLINVGALIARVLDLENLELQVSIRAEEASWLQKPEKNKHNKVTLTPTDSYLKNQGLKWHGELVQLSLGINALDQTREALVKINGSLSGLYPGMLLEAILPGENIAHGIKIPRRAIRDDGSVLLFKDSKLQIVESEVKHADKKEAILVSGPVAGDSIIVTALQNPVPGMKLRLDVKDQASKTPAGKKPGSGGNH